MQYKNKAYFKEVVDDVVTEPDIYFKIQESSENNVNIIEINNGIIIIYDTRISKKAMEIRFNDITMIPIEQNDFNEQIIKKLKKKEESENHSYF